MKRGVYGVFTVILAVAIISWSSGSYVTRNTEVSQENVLQTSPGEALFRENCASCHQMDGSGVPHMTPPLTGTKYVLGDKPTLIKIILNGLTEDIEINGDHFTNPMPSFSYLKDQDIADVLTYVRSNFGNKADAVTQAEVKEVRAINEAAKK